MYPKVGSPKKITMKWLDKAFAPLKDYLDANHPENAKAIMGWMSYRGNFDDLYGYENRMTQGYIEFDRTGKLLHCSDNALEHEYELGYERTPVQTESFHPNVNRWIDRTVSAKKADIFREELRLFLQHVWGPMVNYDFSDLMADYPLRGSGSPYCLYVYPSRFSKMIAFQFVGNEIAEKNCSLREYRKFEESKREFLYQGWHLVTLIREFLAFEPDLSTTCQVVKNGCELADRRVDEDAEFVLTAEGRRKLEELEKEALGEEGSKPKTKPSV